MSSGKRSKGGKSGKSTDPAAPSSTPPQTGASVAPPPKPVIATPAPTAGKGGRKPVAKLRTPTPRPTTPPPAAAAGTRPTRPTAPPPPPSITAGTRPTRPTAPPRPAAAAASALPPAPPTATPVPTARRGVPRTQRPTRPTAPPPRATRTTLAPPPADAEGPANPSRPARPPSLARATRPTAPPPPAAPPEGATPPVPRPAPRAKRATADIGTRRGRVVRPTAPEPLRPQTIVDLADEPRAAAQLAAALAPDAAALAPDAAPPERPVGDAYAEASADGGDWLGAEAAPSPGDYAPAQDRRAELPWSRRSVVDEVSELERRVRARLTPALPIFHRRHLPLEFLWRRYRALAMRRRSDVVDDFGRDPSALARWRPALDFLYDRYFRVRVRGGEHLPASGPALLVANHGGALPYDVLMLGHAVRRETKGREGRPLIEDQLFHTPHLGPWLTRLGAVRACPENAARLLAAEQLVAVFPEGDKGLAKPVGERYRLQRFGRGGYVKLALQSGVPILPVAIVGSDEVNPTLARLPALGRALGLPTLPITPTFPFLGPLGLLPLPVRWHLHLGAPIDLGKSYGPEAAGDPLLVARLSEGIRGTIQALLDDALESRKSLFF